MADNEDNNNEDNPTDLSTNDTEVEDQSPAAPGQVTLTQAEFDAIIKREKGKAARAATKKARESQNLTQTTNIESEQPAHAATDERYASLEEKIESLTAMVSATQARERDGEFTDAVAGYNLTDEQKPIVRHIWDGKAPDANFHDLLTKIGIKQGTSEDDLSPKGPGYQAPHAAPSASIGLAQPSDPTKWTKDDISRMQNEGTFRKNIEKWKSSQGGGGGLFRRKKMSG